MINFADKKLKSIQLLVEDYQQYFSIKSERKQITNLIGNYKKINLFRTYQLKKKNRLNTIQKLVENYKKTNICKKSQKYDLFSELRMKISENTLSNIISDILNPLKSPFGKAIVLNLLQSGNNDYVVEIFKKVDSNNIVVKREQSGDNSRIDIRIYTNLSHENIIIDIEMKVGCGNETTHKKGKSQTVREWEDLNTFANIRKIPSQNIVAYFITPNAKKAVCTNFISLSLQQLNEIILEELKTAQESQLISKDGISACRHFFSSRWLF